MIPFSLSHFALKYRIKWKEAKKTFSFMSPKHSDLSDLIARETEVTDDHLTPEIKLRLITQRCSVWHAREDDPKLTELGKEPFWGFYWPGGQALARFLLGIFFF